MVALDQPGVRDDELAAVEDVVADQAVDEPLGLGRGTPSGSAASCAERLGQPVADLHVAAAQRPDQLVLVVAGHAERVARGRPCPSPAAARRACRDRGRPGRRRRPRVRPGWLAPAAAAGRRARRRSRARPSSVCSSAQQPWTSPMTSNGPVSCAQVVAQPGAGDRRGGDLVLAVQDVDACGSPRCCRPRRDRRSWSCWRRITCVAEVAVGAAGVALRGRRSPARRARSRPASTSCSRASATSALAAPRAARWSRPRRSAAPRPAACRR